MFAVVALASVGLFLGCRALLQQRLYSDLLHIAPQSSGLPQTATTPQLNSAKSWHSTLAVSCFSICFVECCVLFSMLMCQGLGLLTPESRYYSWRASLLLLLATIIILIPASLCMVLTYRSDTPSIFNLRAITIILPVASFIFILSFIPLPVGLTSHNPLTATTARLVVLGTIILGLLSGLGSVNSAWSAFVRQTHVTSLTSVTSAETALERVKSDLRERTRDLEEHSEIQPQAGQSWMSRLTFKRDTREALSMISQNVVHLDLYSLIARSRIAAARSHRFASFGVADDISHCYSQTTSRNDGVFRVLSWKMAWQNLGGSAMNLLSPPPSSTASSSYGDVIAHAFAYLLSLLPLDGTRETPGIDIASLSRQISLVLVGVIIFSSIRVVLMGVMKVFRITSRSMSASLMLLVLAKLMGIYLLSTVVQLRTMFPPPSNPGAPQDVAEINLLSTLPEYSLFGGLFDWSFLFGATGCALTRWAGGYFDNDVDI
ncbi:Abscisic acid G-protein coupled receptor-domain-containing protein [Scleroderma yunnanense]